MDISNIKQEDVIFLAQNDCFFWDGQVFCRTRPSDDALAKLRATPQHYADLLQFLAIGDYHQAKWFQQLETVEIPSDDIVELNDSITQNSLTLDFKKKLASKVLYSGGSEALKRINTKSNNFSYFYFSDPNLTHNEQGDEPSSFFLVDWDTHSVYTGKTDMLGGDFKAVILPLATACGSIETCLEWARLRQLYDDNLPQRFNPMLGI